MRLEDQSAYLQGLKDAAGLDLENPRDRLLAEVSDTVALLCHQLSSLGVVVDGVSETLEELQDILTYELEDSEDGNSEMGVDEYFDGSESPLYEVKCPQCGDRFAVDEHTLTRGFACPTCGEKLIQAE